jgi:hypothetical protein
MRMPDSKTTVPSLVSSAWRTAPPVLRRFAYWVWGIGLVAVTVSIVADERKWWGSLQFTSNIVAEAICGMVALPLALLVIGRLAEFQVRELDRVRLDARYATVRVELSVAVRATRMHLEEIVEDVTASTDAFVGALKVEDGVVTRPELANEKARILHAQMDSQQWLMYERFVAPLRIVGTHLQSLLIERDRNGALTTETTNFAQVWIELESELAQQKQIMANGHGLLGNRPAVYAEDVNGANRLRDLAIEHLHGIDRLVGVCNKLEAYATGSDAVPPVART